MIPQGTPTGAVISAPRLRGRLSQHRPDNITILRRLDDGTVMFVIYHEIRARHYAHAVMTLLKTTIYYLCR